MFGAHWPTNVSKIFLTQISTSERHHSAGLVKNSLMNINCHGQLKVYFYRVDV